MPKATLVGIVPYGTGYFIDIPDQVGSYYYAVLIKSETGTTYQELIPFRNKTVTPVRLDSVAPEEERAARISSIKAEVVKDHILVRFVASRGDRDLILYRSTVPILSVEQLTAATEVKRFPSSETEVSDYPVPGVPYYYAVVDAKLLEMKLPRLEKGNNVTSTYVEIPLPNTALPAISILPPLNGTYIRPIPLPFYLLKQSFESGNPLPSPSEYGVPPAIPIPTSTLKVLQDLVAPLPEPQSPLPSPTILPFNKGDTGQKEEQMLQAVLKGPFKNREWKEVILQLDLLSRLPLSEEARSQVYFYRGQAKFFLAQYRESVLDFLLATRYYFSETQPWIDAVLQTMSSR
ncbi:MAG: hypothetical protein N2442_14690 [Spirochaetes bacterium]|nr:hypothetical protein [Spirochaetota bacterium]